MAITFDKADLQAAQYLKNKQKALESLGAPKDGIPYAGASITDDLRTRWAAYFAYRRTTGLAPRNVSGMTVWSVKGKRAGITCSVDYMEGGILVLNQVGEIPENEFTDEDFERADAYIEQLGLAG